MNEQIVQRLVVIKNEQGLHARPAQMMARLALQFESMIDLVRDSQRVDAKSILHVLTLGADQGTELIIEAKGPDAEEALDALVRLVESEFATDETISQESSG
ncbi:HPr family phosphocarrier protein [Bythopirellula polymerisocia]|uniref:Phosphocarrier protein HPr n=1 Tax=Bythopirellula polymerisocia TaxID=2528003 RepID=A0A5C6D1H0_9BACT|nr:HPr family phosphocarrier protein [Bythopirellula polymerisocia]TWU29507.1 Phosphocarrier protein HPr [Bythopirellula polymerisocia]